MTHSRPTPPFSPEASSSLATTPLAVRRHLAVRLASAPAARLAGSVPAVFLGMVGVVAVLAAGCTPAEGPQGGATGAARAPVPVAVGRVEVRTVPVTFHAIGHVEPIETVAVRARVGGELQQVHFEEGSSVAPGQTLFTIDQRPHRAALAQAKATLERERALLVKAEADVTRYGELVERDFVTREQYDQITADAAALRASVAADEARVDSARLDLEYCTITSPISGRTGSLAVKTGTLIKANDDRAMVTINRTRPIYAAFSVPAQLLPQIRANQSASIRVVASLPNDGTTTAEGRLSFVDNAVDTATSTVLLKATFANADEHLWPGQFVDLTVIVGTEADRLVCPAPAIQTGQQGAYVFVVKDDGTVEQRLVTVVRSNEVEAVIESSVEEGLEEGLKDGDTVVTDGQLRLVSGAAITVKDAVGAAGSTP